MIYLELFLGFLQVGAFAFGGAYATIPLIRDIVTSHGWMTDEMLNYMIAVSESSPGPIMVNLATYVGSDQAGLLGAVVATFAVVLPAFAVIILACAVFKKLLSSQWFKAALAGLKPCIIGVVLATGIYLTTSNMTGDGSLNTTAVVITVILAGVMLAPSRFGKNVSPIALICIAAVLGVIVYA